MKFPTTFMKALLFGVAVALPTPKSLNMTNSNNSDTFHDLTDAEIAKIVAPIPTDIIDPFHKDYFGTEYSNSVSVNSSSAGMFIVNVAVPSVPEGRQAPNEKIHPEMLTECYRHCFDENAHNCVGVGDVRELTASQFCNQHLVTTSHWVMYRLMQCTHAHCHGCRECGERSNRWIEYTCGRKNFLKG
ncbi:hypothetical protein GGR57DRAFT_516265 [Xylariaceae sp. FL1272]|nr:hypothetical protein GGR57DRAFT_516265 [Xylariaceae sp. FL1272]